MASTEEMLSEIEQLILRNKAKDAENKLRNIMEVMSLRELQVWDYDLRNMISGFLPKRRRNLLSFLDKRMGIGEAVQETPNESSVLSDKVALFTIKMDFRKALEELSTYHIFQWSTFYRDCFSEFFAKFLSLDLEELGDDLNKVLDEELAKHTSEIFLKGYTYTNSIPGNSEYFALTKSLSGLQRFLELPIEFYSARLSSLDAKAARNLRILSGAFIEGILKGYGQVKFSKQIGWKVLPRFPRAWAHYLSFLTASQLDTIIQNIEPGDFREGVERSVCYLVAALDAIGSQASGYIPLPTLGQLVWDNRRLDVSIRPPRDSENPQLIEIQCYLDSAFVSLPSLQEAASRGVSVVLAPLRPDLQDFISKSETLARIVIATSATEKISSVQERVRQVIEAVIYKRRSRRAKSAPITYNFAREFPLQNPFLTKYFHVYRHSVRNLLRSFERRNGVRLWCSVRRSGKTVACFDLGTTTGTSTIISETCDSTGQFEGANSFYEAVSDALSCGKVLPKTFFMDQISKGAPGKYGGTDRFVFVLDEYETLFGRLKTAVTREPDLRYTVVQPLLNQMVAFTRDNLLVFMGQQPNAHFILMDQNQLSAYVQQDSFPLFEHVIGTIQGEFSELISKVLTERVSFDGTFADALYEETAGHPFLTVKVLISLVDWLIEKRSPSYDLRLTRNDFAEFASEGLSPKNISIKPEYDFFREAIAESLSTFGKTQNPWLYSVYCMLRRIAGGSKDLSCTRSDFERIAEDECISELGLNADQILRTGSQANFFYHEDDVIRPKIKVLGRIACTAIPRVVP